MVNEDYDQIEPEDEDEANVDSTYTPNAARNYNATRNYNAAPKSSNAYSQKEFIQIFDWVQARMREVRRRLNMADFDIIATWRNDEFVGKWVEEGEELANGSLAPFTYAYPARNGKSLHSFCTKKSPKGDSYDLLLTNWTRIWARGDAMAANADEGEGGEEEADNDDDYTDEGEAEGVDDDEMDDEADGDDV